MTNDMLVKCILKDGELDIKTTVRAQFTMKKNNREYVMNAQTSNHLRICKKVHVVFYIFYLV